MLKKRLVLLLMTATLTAPLFAQADNQKAGDAATAYAYIKEIQKAGAAYMSAHDSAFFKALAKGQSPRATVVTCSDSRIHTNALDSSPEGDLFVVRNIGNQLATSMGSVQYGVNHLNSSLLLIIGHSRCGAISAASGDYSKLEDPVRKELDTINITRGVTNIAGVKTNVNNQITAALKEWPGKVKKGELLVVGAIYDFADDLQKGAGKLNIININGETDPAKLRNIPVQATKAQQKR